jgi:hypothetical protein
MNIGDLKSYNYIEETVFMNTDSLFKKFYLLFQRSMPTFLATNKLKKIKIIEQ